MTIQRHVWGEVAGSEVELFTLTHTSGIHASISSYGATLVSLWTPDRTGCLADIVLGYDDLQGYVEDSYYMGCLIGRCAGRVGNARFDLNGVTYQLDRNAGPHHLHGGGKGFHTRIWTPEPLETEDGPALELRLVSADGDQGYPGTVHVSVVYTLLESGLRIDLSGSTDKPTPLNMTNHSYFNLRGHDAGRAMDQELMVCGARYLVCESQQLPTGDIGDVTKTPLDFRAFARLGDRVDCVSPLLRDCAGYDQYVFIDGPPGELRQGAELYDSQSGRRMIVRTTQQGMQLYTGNYLPEKLDGKGGAVYARRAGVCIETQGCPDAPNHDQLPSVWLQPGESYEQTTEFLFRAE